VRPGGVRCWSAARPRAPVQLQGVGLYDTPFRPTEPGDRLDGEPGFELTANPSPITTVDLRGREVATCC